MSVFRYGEMILISRYNVKLLVDTVLDVLLHISICLNNLMRNIQIGITKEDMII